MKLLDQYIGSAVLQSTVVVMVVLLSLFAFATFAGELDKVGSGGYGALQAMQYTALLLPGLAYQMFPIVILLGAIIGLGTLASQSELIVVRAAGISIKRIVWSVMKVGLLLMFLMIFVGEVIAPKAEYKAQSLKAESLSGQASFRTEEGLWARDGRKVIYIRDLFSENRVANVSIYEFDDRNRLKVITTASRGDFENDNWHLSKISSSRIDQSGVVTTHSDSLVWESKLIPDLISVVSVKPEYLSIFGLYRYINYLDDNGLDSSKYSLAINKKLFLPLTTGVMIFLAVPFVFGPLRSVGVGQRIFVGTLFGIGYFLVDQTTGQMGIVYGIPPLVSVLIAPLTFLAVAFYLVRRVF